MIRFSVGRFIKNRMRSRRGAILLLFALVLVGMLGLMALSLDLGYVCSVRTDLQAAVDAGALAGAGVLLDGPAATFDTGRKFTEWNLNNQGVQTTGRQADVDVQIGHWDKELRAFSPGGRPRDAVRVTAELEKASLFFGGAAGQSKFAAQASAIATYMPRDIMLVLDVSGSMNEARGGVRKIDELRESVSAFLDYMRRGRGPDRVGFTYYSTTASFGQALSYDLRALEAEIMKHLNPGGWTNIADGMQLARDELNGNGRDSAQRLIVLLTDGAANMNQPGNVRDPAEAKARVLAQAEMAKFEKIPIFTMALDSLTAEVDVELMRQVAEITDCESFHVIAGQRDAQGHSQLHEAFRRVANDRPLRLVD